MKHGGRELFSQGQAGGEEKDIRMLIVAASGAVPLSDTSRTSEGIRGCGFPLAWVTVFMKPRRRSIAWKVMFLMMDGLAAAI